MGDKLNAMMPDNITHSARVAPNWKNSLPVNPFTKPMGAYTAARVIVMATIAKTISLVPTMAAGMACNPVCICRWQFSSTTIASSTTRPIARTIASKVNVLSSKPNQCIGQKTLARQMGMVIMGIRAARKLPRNKITTKPTNRAASKNVIYTSWMDCLIKRVESNTISALKEGGKPWFREERDLRSEAATSIGLAVDCAKTARPTADLPFIRNKLSSFWLPTLTLATSDSRMSWWFLCAITRSENFWAFFRRAWVTTV